jgi:fatty-acyl-CoA synthase
MMEYPLLLRTFLLRAAKYFPKKEIVSVYPNETFRYTYADYFRRTCQLANALKSLGIKRGDHIASLALNSHRHLELYFGVPCMGAALHTVNFRLPLHHLVYVLNHAEDKVIFIEEDLLFFIEAIKDQLKTIITLSSCLRAAKCHKQAFHPFIFTMNGYLNSRKHMISPMI